METGLIVEDGAVAVKGDVIAAIGFPHGHRE